MAGRLRSGRQDRGEGHPVVRVGLAQFLTETGVDTVEVDRPNRQKRRKQGGSDPNRRGPCGSGGAIGCSVGDPEDPQRTGLS